MNLELGILNDGGVMMVSDRPLPHVIKRVEFYRDQRLLMLVYDNDEKGSDLMDYEVPIDMTNSVEKSPEVVIYMLFPNEEPLGYSVPLVKVGDIY